MVNDPHKFTARLMSESEDTVLARLSLENPRLQKMTSRLIQRLEMRSPLLRLTRFMEI
jgi:hypothetical protein